MSGTEQREHQQEAPGLQRLRRKVTGLAVAGALGGFLFGFDSSVVNGAVNPIADHFHLSSTITGLAVASALIGCAVGAILGGRIGDRYGRIPTMVVAAVLFFVSAIGAGLASDVWLFILWRLIGVRQYVNHVRAVRG